MPSYIVNLTMTVSSHVELEAENEDVAREIVKRALGSDSRGDVFTQTEDNRQEEHWETTDVEEAY